MRKLLKYELMATARIFGLLMLVMLAAAVLGGIGCRVITIQSSQDAYSLAFLPPLALGILLMVISSICAVCFVVMRFYRNLLGPQGYLMHTLPVPAWQLFLSKLLTALFWYLIISIFGAVCYNILEAIALLGTSYYGVADREILAFAQSMSEFSGSPDIFTLTDTVHSGFTVLRRICLFYFCCTLGQGTHHPVLVGVLGCLAILAALRAIGTGADIMFWMSGMNGIGTVAECVVYALEAVLFSILAIIRLSRRLNLQ